MTSPPRPFTLIAELTHRCPLGCTYCSNPLALIPRTEELPTHVWQRVFHEAEELGVVQLHLTGGEPLVRHDLEELVAHARSLELYTHLVTSGVPLTFERLAGLRDRGLDAVQLSIQDVERVAAARVAGTDVWGRKLEVAAWIRELGVPLTLNVVLHRGNIERCADFVSLAERIGADRLELANAQYLGWGFLNRRALLPSLEQVLTARAVASEATARLAGRMEVVFVLPDYFAGAPKACMDGWGRRYIVVAPDGLGLPCHHAHTLPGLTFHRVTDHPLGDLWRESAGFNAYRGEAWMTDPCRTCDRRSLDFGGCRCQAFHLTGRADVADPACRLSAEHQRLRRLAAEPPGDQAPRYRGSARRPAAPARGPFPSLGTRSAESPGGYDVSSAPLHGPQIA